MAKNKKRKSSHTTTKNTKPKLNKEYINMAKLTGGPVIDVQDDFTTHYGPNGATTVNWLKPTLISKKIIDNKMYLELLWGGQIIGGKKIKPDTIATSIIGKGKTGKFVYHTDTDELSQNTVFENLDELLWEYEIPRELKQEILDLPNSDMSEEFYIDQEKAMKYHYDMAMTIHKNNF